MTRGTCGLTGYPLGLNEVIGALLTGGLLGLTRGPWGVTRRVSIFFTTIFGPERGRRHQYARVQSRLVDFQLSGPGGAKFSRGPLLERATF